MSAAKIPIGFCVGTVLPVWIDRRSAIFEKLSSEDIRKKDEWKSVYQELHESAQKSRCIVQEFDGMAGWTNPLLNDRLLLSSGANSRLVSYSQEQSPWLAYDKNDWAQKSRQVQLRKFVIDRAFKGGHLIFNSDKVRLVADIDPSLNETVRLQKTDYVSSMITDGVAFEYIFYPVDISSICDGYSSFIEKRSDGKQLKSLLHSESSNQLGASTLAFSSDGFLILVEQTDQNRHGGGKLSPSGSGSFDWSDLCGVPGDDFLTLVKRAAARELREELGLDKEAASERSVFVREHMVIIGFTRLIHRAGKPEFFCVAWIDKTMEEVRALKRKGMEISYTQKAISHDAAALDQGAPFDQEIRRICRHYIDATRRPSNEEITRRHRLSYQVMHGLALLEGTLADARSVDTLKKVLRWTDRRSDPRA